MTCIVGIEFDGGVAIGADSCAGDADRYSKIPTTTPKVFQLTTSRGENIIAGYTTSFRMGQVIAHTFTPPDIGQTLPERYMVTSFIPALQKTLKNERWLKDDNGIAYGGRMLVGIHGDLFMIDDDFCVIQSLHGFDAIGSGGELAIGRLDGLTCPRCQDVVNVQKYALYALRTAAKFSAYVMPPYRVLALIHKHNTVTWAYEED